MCNWTSGAPRNNWLFCCGLSIKKISSVYSVIRVEIRGLGGSFGEKITEIKYLVQVYSYSYNICVPILKEMPKPGLPGQSVKDTKYCSNLTCTAFPIYSYHVTYVLSRRPLYLSNSWCCLVMWSSDTSVIAVVFSPIPTDITVFPR